MHSPESEASQHETTESGVMSVVLIKRYLEEFFESTLRKKLEENQKERPAARSMHVLKHAYIDAKMRYAKLLNSIYEYLDTHNVFTIEEFDVAVPMAEWDEAERSVVHEAINDYINRSVRLTDVLRDETVLFQPSVLFRRLTGEQPEGKVNVWRHGPFLVINTECRDDYNFLYTLDCEEETWVSMLESASKSGGFFRTNALIETSDGSADIMLIVVRSQQYTLTHERQHGYNHLTYYRSPATKRIDSKEEFQQLLQSLCNGRVQKFHDEMMAVVQTGNEKSISPATYLSPNGNYFFAPLTVEDDVWNLTDEQKADWNPKELWQQLVVQPYRLRTALMRNIAEEMIGMDPEIQHLFEVEPGHTWYRLYRWLHDTGILSATAVAEPNAVLDHAKRLARRYDENARSKNVMARTLRGMWKLYSDFLDKFAN